MSFNPRPWGLVTALLVCSALDAQVAHFYFVEDQAALDSLEKNIACIEVLSPVWFTVTQNGNLLRSMNPKVLRLANRNSVPLLPVVMNRDFRPEIAAAVLGSKAIKDRLVKELVATASTYRFAGLQLDFEQIPAQYRGAYADFAERLSAELRKKHMKLSVAAPSPVFSMVSGDGSKVEWAATDHSAAFDYARLGKAADWITLMAYDQYVLPDQPGPIAGLDWVEACIRKTLEFVPAARLYLGVPLYHRHWDGKVVTTGTYNEALLKSARGGVRPAMDPLQREMRAAFQRDGVPNVVWFHNADSLRPRLELTRKYRLAGFSAWRLGQEDPATWAKVFERKRGSK